MKTLVRFAAGLLAFSLVAAAIAAGVLAYATLIITALASPFILLILLLP